MPLMRTSARATTFGNDLSQTNGTYIGGQVKDSTRKRHAESEVSTVSASSSENTFLGKLFMFSIFATSVIKLGFPSWLFTDHSFMHIMESPGLVLGFHWSLFTLLVV